MRKNYINISRNIWELYIIAPKIITLRGTKKGLNCCLTTKALTPSSKLKIKHQRLLKAVYLNATPPLPRKLSPPDCFLLLLLKQNIKTDILTVKGKNLICI